MYKNDFDRISSKLKYAKGLSNKDIGAILGLSESQIKNKRYGRQKFTKEEIGVLESMLNSDDLTNNTIEESQLKAPKPTYFETKRNKFIEIGNVIGMQVPIIEMTAHAAYVDEFYNEAAEITFAYQYFEVDQYAKGHYLAFKVEGDSMNGGKINDTPNGATVLAREVGVHLWRSGLFLNKYGFILITNRNILFKDIVKTDYETMTVTCHSRNADYDDFELALGHRDDESDEYIRQVFKVIKRYNM